MKQKNNMTGVTYVTPVFIIYIVGADIIRPVGDAEGGVPYIIVLLTTH